MERKTPKMYKIRNMDIKIIGTTTLNTQIVMKSIPGPFMPAPEAFLDHMKKLDPSQSQKSHLIPQKSRGKKGQIKA